MATMEQITVLVVDDSAFMRRAVTDVIERDPRFKVVGTARNGEDALAKIPRLRPQLITMDLEMPGMGGVAAIREIIRQWRLPVVVLSALTQEGATATLDALSAGAVDVFLKQEVLAQVSVRRAGHAADGQGAGDPAVLADFHRRLWMAARANVQGAGTAAAAHGPAPERPAWGVSAPADTAIAPTDTAAAPAGGPAGAGPADAPSAAAHTHSAPAKAPAGRPALVLIGCSTGGPAALQTILPALGGPLPVPVLVVQHIALGFTRHLAERLHQLCRFPVKEAEDGEIARPGTVYIAPSGQQALVVHAPEGVVIRTRPPLASDPPYRPSVDVALTAAAEALGGRVLAVILTGMGKDGLAGCRALKARGGRVIAEAPETCVVYGMPRAVYEAGLADEQAPLYDIPACILRNL